MTSKRRSPSLMRVLAVLAACVLVLGLPRLLVACTSAGHGSHLEWTHAEGACCAHDHHERKAPRAPSRELPCHDADESCEHVELATDLGPMPRAGVPTLPPPALFAVLEPLPAVVTVHCQGRFHAPATGPPRRDAPVCLRSTALLQS